MEPEAPQRASWLQLWPASPLQSLAYLPDRQRHQMLL